MVILGNGSLICSTGKAHGLALWVLGKRGSSMVCKSIAWVRGTCDLLSEPFCMYGVSTFIAVLHLFWIFESIDVHVYLKPRTILKCVVSTGDLYDRRDKTALRSFPAL